MVSITPEELLRKLKEADEAVEGEPVFPVYVGTEAEIGSLCVEDFERRLYWGTETNTRVQGCSIVFDNVPSYPHSLNGAAAMIEDYDTVVRAIKNAGYLVPVLMKEIGLLAFSMGSTSAVVYGDDFKVALDFTVYRHWSESKRVRLYRDTLTSGRGEAEKVLLRALEK